MLSKLSKLSALFLLLCSWIVSAIPHEILSDAFINTDVRNIVDLSKPIAKQEATLIIQATKNITNPQSNYYISISRKVAQDHLAFLQVKDNKNNILTAMQTVSDV